MLAIVGGTLALLLGVLALLLPLLTTELSRPRDAFWGAVVLLLGLVLVTSADRLTGAPMLAVLCGGLLIGRLGTEVVQLRWRQLSPEEQQRLASSERWRTALSELATTVARLLSQVGQAASSLRQALAPQPKATSKRWVRPEPPAAEASSAPGHSESNSGDTGVEAAAPMAPGMERSQDTNRGPEVVAVSSFAAIDALIEAHNAGEAAPAERPDQATAG
ncbi:MAG: Ycf66 family protein [Prochlorococcaceae cyanobacterium]